MTTFAVIPSKPKYGGIVLSGSPEMTYRELKDFLKENSLVELVKVPKLKKCFDFADSYASAKNSNGKTVYLAGYRFYAPMFWSKKKIIQMLTDCFDEVVVD